MKIFRRLESDSERKKSTQAEESIDDEDYEWGYSLSYKSL
jgi:hypothetical protein